MKHSIPLLLLTVSLGTTVSNLIGQDALPGDPPSPIAATVPGAAPAPPAVPRGRPGGFGGGGGFATAGAGVNGSEDAFHYEIARNFNFPKNASGRTLVLRGASLDEAKAGELEEDLNVMSRVLDKSMERTAGSGAQDKVLGIFVSGLPGSRTPQNLYLDGYGALFIMNARFPLVPSPNEEKDEKQPKAESSSSWDDARREIYGTPPGMQGMESFERTPVRYDADKVEGLKKEILESLKDAANIRHLKPDDLITVTVMSGDTMFVRGGEVKSVPPRAGATMKSAGPADMKREQALASARSRVEADVARVEVERSRIEAKRAEVQKVRTVFGDGKGRSSALTIRVKKSDVDSFAKGKLDLDGFRKKASITVY
ncbi:MAG: hypothetical protein H7X97_02575 [Opitutaceae bacterium]|nr:hypothetical protein [Verrucomicrobiales bacterium]